MILPYSRSTKNPKCLANSINDDHKVHRFGKPAPAACFPGKRPPFASNSEAVSHPLLLDLKPGKAL